MGGGVGSRQKLTHADVVLAAVAPDVIGHLKPTQTENSSFVLVHVGSPWVSMPEILAAVTLQSAWMWEDKEWWPWSSMVAWWLGFGAFTAEVWVRSRQGTIILHAS